MTYSKTRITTRGYDVTMPTAAVAGFLALSHDDQVELADELNRLEGVRDQFDMDLDEDEIVPGNADMIGDLIEGMAQDLEHQDQAIDAHMDENAELKRLLALKRDEITALVNAGNGLFATANALDQANEAAMAERAELKAEMEQGYAVLVQAANYMADLRAQLASIGIEVRTDHEGQPVLLADPAILGSALQAAMAA